MLNVSERGCLHYLMDSKIQIRFPILFQEDSRKHVHKERIVWVEWQDSQTKRFIEMVCLNIVGPMHTHANINISLNVQSVCVYVSYEQLQ